MINQINLRYYFAKSKHSGVVLRRARASSDQHAIEPKKQAKQYVANMLLSMKDLSRQMVRRL